MKYSKTSMNESIDKYNFAFKKKFGQNFITDKNIINSIVSKSEIDKDTLVIEIGPGAGSLTSGLCEAAGHVLCYEIDSTLEEMLKENLKDFNNYEVIFDDFLKRNVKEDLKKYHFNKTYVVANLPYYITTPIIIKLISDNLNIDRIAVMVQKEVGDRFKAVPGTKDYNSLSIYLNYYYDVKKLLDVSRNVFIPKPNVDSIVVCFDRKSTKLKLNNEELFFKLVRDSFSFKRKTLRNNLKNYDLNKVSEVLSKYNLDLTVRAENLAIEIFVDIANNL